MDVEYTPGKTVENTKVNTNKTRRMDLALIPGPTARSMLASGEIVNAMEKVNSTNILGRYILSDGTAR